MEASGPELEDNSSRNAMAALRECQRAAQFAGFVRQCRSAPRLAFRQLDPRGHSDLWNGLAGESAGNGMSHSASRVSESRAECGVSRSRLRSRHQGNFHRRLDFFTVHGFNQRFGGFHS